MMWICCFIFEAINSQKILLQAEKIKFPTLPKPLELKMKDYKWIFGTAIQVNLGT